MLFSLGSLFALYEGVDKLIHPHELEDPVWAFAVLGIAVVLEGLSHPHRHPRGVADARRPVVVGASSARRRAPSCRSCCSRTSGRCSVSASRSPASRSATITDQAEFDALGSIAIGILLGVIAVVLAVEMKSLLIGEAATPEELTAISAAIETSPEVTRLIHLRTQHLGPDDLLVAAKVELAATTVDEAARAIDAVEERVRERVPKARVIYFEPDDFRPADAPSSPETPDW